MRYIPPPDEIRITRSHADGAFVTQHMFPIPVLREALEDAPRMGPADMLFQDILARNPDDAAASRQLDMILNAVLEGPKSRQYAQGMNLLEQFAQANRTRLVFTFNNGVPRSSSGRMTRRHLLTAAAEAAALPAIGAYVVASHADRPFTGPQLAANALNWCAVSSLCLWDFISGGAHYHWAQVSDKVTAELAKAVGVDFPATPPASGRDR